MTGTFTYREAAHKCFRRTLRLTPEFRRAGAVLWDAPGVCRCEVRAIGGDPAFAAFDTAQNYPENGLVLEAVLFLSCPERPEWTHLRIGVPLADVPDSEMFEIEYSGPRFTLRSGGKVLDEEFPFGDPPGEPETADRFIPAPMRPPSPVMFTGPLHLWSPAGRNTWAGDVTVGSFNGEFHLFYLHDRRHHTSSFGAGAHTWRHLVTRDLKTWRDDGEILPLQAQWQTYGTGTPFVHDGRLFLSYGLHTERYPAPDAPRGGTWAESTDGQHFTPSDRICTRSENPSVFNLPDGRLVLFEGDDRQRRLVLKAAAKWPDFDAVTAALPLGEDTPTGHSAECPAYFHWHGKHFLLVGFSGMYSADTPDFTPARDLAAEGVDLYDGLDVPMVAPFAGDRRILAGWLRVGGWGGVLGLRELVWCSDGVPGLRWLDEAVPDHGAWTDFSKTAAVDGDLVLEWTVQPGADVRVRLSGEGEDVELRVHAARRKAELVFASIADYPAATVFPRDRNPGGRAAEHLRGLDAPYRVRLLVRNDRKLRGTVADAEIAGLRTLIHYFPGHAAKEIRVSGAATSRIARLAPSPTAKPLG